MTPTKSFQSLPTTYNKIRFRSRMEARWAVFMEIAEIPFLYEPEGYRIGGMFYLPDFYLHAQDAFMEIKNPCATDGDKKPSALAEASGKNVYMFRSNPKCPDDDGFDPDIDSAELVDTDYYYWWCECPHCRRKEIQFNGRGDRIKCDCPRSRHGDKGYSYNTPTLKHAYEMSRIWRFNE